jgi:hypothetical protein
MTTLASHFTYQFEKSRFSLYQLVILLGDHGRDLDWLPLHLAYCPDSDHSVIDRHLDFHIVL